MKATSLMVTLGLFLLPLPKARAQTPAKYQPSSVPASAASPSWLFLLETKNQWLMVLQDTFGTQGTSSSSSPNLAFPSVNQNGNTVSPETSGNLQGHSDGSQGQNPATSNATSEGKGAGSGDPTVFEGNTNDIPLEAPPSGGSPKPSAPSS